VSVPSGSGNVEGSLGGGWHYKGRIYFHIFLIKLSFFFGRVSQVKTWNFLVEI